MKKLEINGHRRTVLTSSDIYQKNFKKGDLITVLLTAEDLRDFAEVTAAVIDVEAGDTLPRDSMPVRVRIFLRYPENLVNLENSFFYEFLPNFRNHLDMWVGCGNIVSVDGFRFCTFISSGKNGPMIFKDGDFVYFPRKGGKVFQLKRASEDPGILYPLVIEDLNMFTEDGKLWEEDEVPSIWHATEENQKKLSEFYGMEFEVPKDPLSKLFPCLCLVSDKEEDLYRLEDFYAVARSFACLKMVTGKTCNRFETTDRSTFKYARPCKVNLDGTLEFVSV